jgi:hypothetical protein
MSRPRRRSGRTIPAWRISFAFCRSRTRRAMVVASGPLLPADHLFRNKPSRRALTTHAVDRSSHQPVRFRRIYWRRHALAEKSSDRLTRFGPDCLAARASYEILSPQSGDHREGELLKSTRCRRGNPQAEAALPCILLLSNARRPNQNGFSRSPREQETCVISTPCCASAISMRRSSSIRTPWG